MMPNTSFIVCIIQGTVATSFEVVWLIGDGAKIFVQDAHARCCIKKKNDDKDLKMHAEANPR